MHPPLGSGFPRSFLDGLGYFAWGQGTQWEYHSSMLLQSAPGQQQVAPLQLRPPHWSQSSAHPPSIGRHCQQKTDQQPLTIFPCVGERTNPDLTRPEEHRQRVSRRVCGGLTSAKDPAPAISAHSYPSMQHSLHCARRKETTTSVGVGIARQCYINNDTTLRSRRRRRELRRG